MISETDLVEIATPLHSRQNQMILQCRKSTLIEI